MIFYLFLLSVWHLREKQKKSKREVKSKHWMERDCKIELPPLKKKKHAMGEKLKNISIVTRMFSRKPVIEIFPPRSITPIYTYTHSLAVPVNRLHVSDSAAFTNELILELILNIFPHSQFCFFLLFFFCLQHNTDRMRLPLTLLDLQILH